MRYKSYCEINHCMISCLRYKVTIVRHKAALWEIKIRFDIKSHNCAKKNWDSKS